MINSYYKDIIKYFNKKAEKYDLVDEQLYWLLSDKLLAKIIQLKLIKPFSKKKELRILDAGAGTGRWSLILYVFLKKNFKLHFDLIDISKKMLNEADKKIKKRGLVNIMKISIGNVEKLSNCPNNYYDIAISFYNVLSFTEKPDRAIKEIFKKLKRKSLYASIVANKYHSYFFNLLNNNINELKEVQGGRVKYSKDMPYIHCFTPTVIKRLYQRAGFKNIEVIGFPNFIYPNIEDTKLEGQSDRNKNILENKDNFRKILNIEFKECFNKDIVGRGNVLLVIGRKK